MFHIEDNNIIDKTISVKYIILFLATRRGATKRMVITEKALLIRLESEAYPSNLITSPFLKCSYRNEESQPGRFICVVSVQTYFYN